jgi:hypothetical protein
MPPGEDALPGEDASPARIKFRPRGSKCSIHARSARFTVKLILAEPAAVRVGELAAGMTWRRAGGAGDDMVLTGWR